jgi:hypothetical protein
MLFIFSTPVLIRHLWQLETVVFLHWCLIRVVLFLTVLHEDVGLPRRRRHRLLPRRQPHQPPGTKVIKLFTAKIDDFLNNNCHAPNLSANIRLDLKGLPEIESSLFGFFVSDEEKRFVMLNSDVSIFNLFLCK